MGVYSANLTYYFYYMLRKNLEAAIMASTKPKGADAVTIGSYYDSENDDVIEVVLFNKSDRDYAEADMIHFYGYNWQDLFIYEDLTHGFAVWTRTVPTLSESVIAETDEIINQVYVKGLV